MTGPGETPPSDGVEPPAPEGDVRASFFDHLTELRKRLVRALLGVGIGVLVAGWFSEDLFRIVMRPVLASLPEGQRALNYTSYLEPFLVYLKVALYGGLFAAAPWVLYQLWEFIAPGLYKKEKKVVVPFVVTGTALFEPAAPAPAPAQAPAPAAPAPASPAVPPGGSQA